MARYRKRNLKLEQSWRRHIAAWSSCDLTVKEYCRRQDLSIGQFRHWQKEIRKRDAERDRSETSFASVTVVPSVSLSDDAIPDDGVEVILPNRMRIRCGRSVAAELIARIIPSEGTLVC